MARLRLEKFKVPRPLFRATPTFKVPCPPFKQSFDGAILTLRFDNYLYIRPSNCLRIFFSGGFVVSHAKAWLITCSVIFFYIV